MESSHSQSNVYSVDSVTSPDMMNCESSGGDVADSGPLQTTNRSSRHREPLEPLIVAALRSAPDKRLILTDIYRYIEAHSADYRDTAASLPPSTSAGDDARRPRRTNDPAWKIHVRHILSVRRDVFPLSTEKDGKRRGRYHALDELMYAKRLAAKAQRSGIVNACGLKPSQGSTANEPAKRRHKMRSHGDADTSTRRQTDVSCLIDFQRINYQA